MSLAEDRRAERRRRMLLAPLIVAGNAFLFLCMVALGIIALHGDRRLGMSPLTGNADQRIVRDYLAETVPSYRYRIREWFPPKPLDGHLAAVRGRPAKPVTEKGVAQRVKLVFYGPSGARQLDTAFWVQNGRVTRREPAIKSQSQPVGVRRGLRWEFEVEE
jgi:hypothetical protein